MNRPSYVMLPGGVAYPAQEHTGYWGPPTSTIDWCEENYVVSEYIAEAVNTVTNAFFVLLALYALRNTIRYQMELRFVISTIGFVLVGVGSWLFHMTLRYEFQLLDELPMIYATCIPCWSVFQTNKSEKQSRQIAVGIAAGALTLTAVYLRSQNPTIHQAAYGGLNTVIIITSVMQSKHFVKDEAVRREMHRMLTYGITEFLLAWLIWNSDIHFCAQYRALRHIVGMPYGFVLEGHGWWHLLTGLAVYNYLVYLEYLRLFIVGRQDEYEFSWKFKLVPVVSLKPKRAAARAPVSFVKPSSKSTAITL